MAWPQWMLTLQQKSKDEGSGAAAVSGEKLDSSEQGGGAWLGLDDKGSHVEQGR